MPLQSEEFHADGGGERKEAMGIFDCLSSFALMNLIPFCSSSFRQNIFHFSFMVKESKAAIKTWTAEEAEEYGGLPGPVIRPAAEIEKPPPRQAIVSLNMKVRI